MKARSAWVGALLLSSFGCAGAVESSRLEDRARRAVPVAVCLKPLPRHGGEGVVSSMQPADYWSLVLPTFDAGSNSFDRSAPDCAGRSVFDSPQLAGAEGPRTGQTTVKADEDAIVTPAADGLRVVWLRTHTFADATAAGPLALVRPRAGYAEVYATGFYRGRAKDSHFSLERMGPRLLVTVSDEGCAGVRPNQSCESSFSVYMMRAGQLLPAARFPLDRIDYRSMSGAVGTAQVRLTATPVFQERTLRVAEQVVVRDGSQGMIRKSDLERTYELSAAGRLSTSGPSLWQQVVDGSAAPAAESPAPPAVERPRPKLKRF